MPKREENLSESSLELLLDTISNAFGGILFLTILIVLLIKMSHPKSLEKMAEPVSADARHELIEKEAQLTEVLANLETLELARAAQEAVRTQLVGEELSRQVEEVITMRKQRQQAEAELLQMTQAVATTQKQIDEHEQELADLAAQEEKVAAQLATAKDAVAKARSTRTQDRRPTRTRSTQRMEASIVIRYGRVYQDTLFDSSRFRNEINLDDFIVLRQENGRTVLTPKPYAGIPVSDGPEFVAALKGKLARTPPSDWYVCICVWEDSFGEFARVRDRLVQLGYEYRIIPVADGGSVGKGHVPDPQVQ